MANLETLLSMFIQYSLSDGTAEIRLISQMEQIVGLTFNIKNTPNLPDLIIANEDVSTSLKRKFIAKTRR